MIPLSKSGYFLIVIIIVIIGCNSSKKTTVPISSQANQINDKDALGYTIYQFRGKVYTISLQPCLADVVALGASGYIYGVTTTYESGNYSFSLPAEKASKVTGLRVTSAQYDTILQTFAPARLRDSIVINDFIMNLIPIEYYIDIQQNHWGLDPVPPDTTLLENRSKPIPKKNIE